MASSRIGALRVDLGANTAAFEKGISKAERRMEAFSKQMKKIGGKISGIGKSLSVGITAPVAAAATAFGVAAHKMAGDSRELAKSAQVAGESFEQFQRQAFAASSVGIEFEKLGDIFKDVRDRVGDFAATGGGPMADFFENIAPKVGVTAEAFKGLSGKESLQLYFDSLRKANVSQEEMVFYLEAMASDATNLIPLLEQNGKAFDALGRNAEVISDEDRANLENYTKAQEKLAQATQKLTIALVNSGILDTITSLVQKFAEWTSDLAETNPTVLKVGVVVAGLAAALGPVLVAIGSIVSIAPAVVKGFLVIKTAILALNPVVAAIAAAVAAAYLVWQNWDEITAIVQRVYRGVKMWLQDKLAAVFKWMGDKVSGVTGFFKDMYVAVVGNSYVPDMVQEIGQEFARLDQLMVNPAQKAAMSVQDAMREMATETRALLARLFPEIEAARQMASDKRLIEASGLSDAQKAEARFRLVGGRDMSGVNVDVSSEAILPGYKKVIASAERLGETMAKQTEKTKVQTVQIARSFGDMAKNSVRALQDMANAIKGGGFLDILGAAVGLFTQLGSTGLFGKNIAANINAPRIPGNANGTKFSPGGLSIVGERGPELVNMNRGGSVVTNREFRKMNGASNVHVTVGIDPANGNITAFVNGQIAATAPAIAEAGAAMAQEQMAQAASRRFR